MQDGASSWTPFLSAYVTRLPERTLPGKWAHCFPLKPVGGFGKTTNDAIS